MSVIYICRYSSGQINPYNSVNKLQFFLTIIVIIAWDLSNFYLDSINIEGVI